MAPRFVVNSVRATIARPTIAYLPSLIGSGVLALVPVAVIKWDINPETFPSLFDPNLPGSLYHILTPRVLNTINAAAQGLPGLIPIVLVHDMAHDPSFIVRNFKYSASYSMIYM